MVDDKSSQAQVNKVEAFLNREVSYWQGMSSSEFWSDFINKSYVKFSLASSIFIMSSVIYLTFIREEINTQLVLFSLCSLPIFFIMTISGLINSLKLYQLKIQLTIIQAAQKQQLDSKL